MAKDMAKNENT